MKEIKKREAVDELTRAGWRIIRSDGRHDVWASPDGKQSFPLPRHRTVSPGVVRKLAKALGRTPGGWE